MGRGLDRAVAHQNELDASLLEVPQPLPQLRDGVSAVNSTEVAEKDDHERSRHRQVAEPDGLSLNVQNG
jgi:hypothetical protein